MTEKQPGAVRPVPSPEDRDGCGAGVGALTSTGESMELAPFTTLRVGGPAARFVSATTTDRVIDAVSECDARGEPVLVLGGGSNLLVADTGFPGTAVRIETRGLTLEAADPCGGATVRVAAGESWDGVVAAAVDHGWAGVEALSGIPGSAGATPLQNVGAYGQEVSETIASVRTWDRQEGRVRTLASADCEFTYRHSRFKEERFRGGPRFVILEVTFQLRLADISGAVRYPELARALHVEVGGRAPLAEVRAVVLALRRSKGMVLDPDDHDTWSAGSFFTNPVLGAAVAARLPDDAPRWPVDGGRLKTSAAWLIEHAGFGRGYGLPGPVALSTRHALALTNRGGARAKDILELARTIRDGVWREFGIELHPEPALVGLAM